MSLQIFTAGPKLVFKVGFSPLWRISNVLYFHRFLGLDVPCSVATWEPSDDGMKMTLKTTVPQVFDPSHYAL